MQARNCPRCRVEYRDTMNTISIALNGTCMACEEDTERFENEGGPTPMV